jgi:class 3 adenylate cyclase
LVGTAAENLEGERKTVTALFADIKGSTELMVDLDPEEARAIIDPALKLMIDAARRYDGYVVQSTGDGIFALFGAPVAHEDHPQRAYTPHARCRKSCTGIRQAARSAVCPMTPSRARAMTGKLQKCHSCTERVELVGASYLALLGLLRTSRKFAPLPFSDRKQEQEARGSASHLWSCKNRDVARGAPVVE